MRVGGCVLAGIGFQFQSYIENNNNLIFDHRSVISLVLFLYGIWYLIKSEKNKSNETGLNKLQLLRRNIEGALFGGCFGLYSSYYANNNSFVIDQIVIISIILIIFGLISLLFVKNKANEPGD